MNKDMTLLVQRGKMKSLNPEKMTAEDVLAFMGYRKSLGLKESEIAHDLTALRNLLAFVGNPAVEQFKVKYRTMVPKRRQGRFPPMKEIDFDIIVRASENVRDDDWEHLKAYSVVMLSICAGLRNKELCLSDVGDLDSKEWMFHARRVKGEATYGQARDIPVRPEAHRILIRYLKLREKKVAECCPNNKALFPALRDKEDGYYSGNSLQKLKTLVEKDTGIKFDLRKCRRTFGQLALDEDVNIESVSVLMGHSTTKTTENSYCRRKQDLAIREVRMTWNGNGLSGSQPGAKTPQIESKWEVSGYV